MRKIIEENNNLERETKSGAVLSRDSTSLSEAKERKKKRKADREKINDLEANVANLNKKIDDMHGILASLHELIRSKE